MFRIYVEKKADFAVEAKALLKDLEDNLGISSIKRLRILNRYDVDGISEYDFERAKIAVLSEPPVDMIYGADYDFQGITALFATAFLPGQFDQRANSAAECIALLTENARPQVATAKVILLEGAVTDEEVASIKAYYINPVEMRETSMDMPISLSNDIVAPDTVATIDGFIGLSMDELMAFREDNGLAMSNEDIAFCQKYFVNEKRDPTITEIKVIDTYWSDHCRHTTFNTVIEAVEIEKNKYTSAIELALASYLEARKTIYAGRTDKDMCLMDIAVMAMKEQRAQGKLNDLEVSEEINACSIIVDANIDGQSVPYLVMFKNETHNHPTEIEPFGGAATCLGGAIRDPLSGRSYVYGAMRVTGSGDPRVPVSQTIAGKLSQRKITTSAAAGYSSYGNQIGLATGQVSEIYNEGYIAKRMEVGAVIGAAPMDYVKRLEPKPGDVIILLGGKTGRDGCGGATGSSKEHDENSLETCGAEVQKGNPPTERKIQRLFRNETVSKMIKRCNDFGAGGVSVAVGELADGLYIELDKVPKKYEGLDGTELAISESQERMAVVIEATDKEEFIKLSNEENLEAIQIAIVTEEPRLVMMYRGNAIVNVSREFLNTNGVKQHIKVSIKSPKSIPCNLITKGAIEGNDLCEQWLNNLADINVCSQKGLAERFDSSIGANTVLMPFGGKYQRTPQEGLAMKLPVRYGETTTATLMSYGFNPLISTWNTFHGAIYAVMESVTKIIAMGGELSRVRLTLQEYFEKLGKDEEKWGKPLGALLGAYYAQKKLDIPAIGGKDSMSGTFKDISVPPTLISFAVAPIDMKNIVSKEIKNRNTKLIYVSAGKMPDDTPDFDKYILTMNTVTAWIKEGKIKSAGTIGVGGIAATISKMLFGNMIGFDLTKDLAVPMFTPDYLGLLLEVDKSFTTNEITTITIGETDGSCTITAGDIVIDLNKAYNKWSSSLEKVFPTKTDFDKKIIPEITHTLRNTKKPRVRIESPRVLIPVFPGTNCEYDTARAFERAGAQTEIFIINNLNEAAIKKTIDRLVESINKAQIIALPGGFSGGDEPDGSAKFIATTFRNPKITKAVHELLDDRDGLMLGICNGFQALIKLGLLPNGHISNIDDHSATLTYNQIGRHMSGMVKTRIASVKSPWLSKVSVGDIHTVPISHGEGRFIASETLLKVLIDNGQVATQYVDYDGKPSYDIEHNPNNSIYAIEGITSSDGRIFGKMAHTERRSDGSYKNIIGEVDQQIIEAGVRYFK